jgi:hypothetical protein
MVAVNGKPRVKECNITFAHSIISHFGIEGMPERILCSHLVIT